MHLDISRGGTLNMFESVNIMTIKAKQADYGIQVILKGLSVQFYVTLGIHAKIVSIVRFTMIPLKALSDQVIR